MEDSYNLDISNNSPTIVDIGAHIGLSILYFKDIFPSSKILAFEPNPRNFELLEMNVFNNNLRNVNCINRAIHLEEGTRRMYFSEDNPSTSSFQKGAWDKTEKNQISFLVDCIPLNHFINERVDLLKMDIEGLEAEVILNSRKALEFVSNFIFEYHYSKSIDFDKIRRFLESCGFTCFNFKDLKSKGLCIVKCSKG